MNAAATRAAPVRTAETVPQPSTTAPRRPSVGGPVIGNQARLRLSRIGGAAIQAKLSFGAVDDPLEAEADRAADQVMRMPASEVAAAAAPAAVQRRCAACDEDEGTLRPLGANK